MKKIFFSVFIFLIFCIIFAGCGFEEKQTVDLWNYAFVNVDWTRKSESCTENIHFDSDGSCSYYCACGEPVNDDDLCEGYTYDPETHIIYLDFAETTDQTVTEIFVKSCDGETLVLDFDGDIRTFKKSEDGDQSVPDSNIEYNGKKYIYLEFNNDIFYYDLRESINYEEDKIVPIPHNKWDFAYLNGDIYILDSQAEDAIAYYKDDKNYKWSVAIDEDSYTVPLSLSSEDIDYIYSMDSMKKETTLLFDDIEKFASLVKVSDDGLISASASLAFFENGWYWRSETIDESVEGWPEYVVKLPDSISKQIK